MKTLLKFKIYTLGVLLLLCGCSIFSNPTERTTFKSNATTSKPLVIPDDLSSSQIKDYYPLPKVEKPFKDTGKVSIIPPGSNVKQ